MDQAVGTTTQMIPIDRITIVNPRVRNRKVFREIVDNIAELGLKRPITVTPRQREDGPGYDLICGQGRLEAYQVLGQREIPAIVVEADSDDCMIMSLVENIARRQHRAIDLLRDVEGLKRRGYNEADIARKTDLSPSYVNGVVRLIENGELRLLRGVESGQIPLSVAVTIAEANDEEVQNALQEAYEKNLLRGKKLIAARHIIEMRQRRGKGLRTRNADRSITPSTTTNLVKAYRDDVEKKRQVIRKVEFTRDRLLFVAAALRTLLVEETFTTLLRAERLETMPRNLAERLQAGFGA